MTDKPDRLAIAIQVVVTVAFWGVVFLLIAGTIEQIAYRGAFK